ncbi:MAG: hypothetical protein JWR26_2080 [Pedosphaera sp.]|nr:hypothetical protein [Pedosphaera sp.]
MAGAHHVPGGEEKVELTMSFSFLNPLLWLGLIAIAAPLWLHLRHKTETNLFKFSALRFLDDQPQPRRSPLRLRDILLFILRALALLMVVSAFAWPYRKSGETAVIKESLVYVLDNTMSHQANDGFAHDRDRILSELAKAGREVQIAVIELTSQPRVIVAFGDDRELARQKLKGLEPSFQRGSYLAAFHQADTLLVNSFGEHKRIIFCGDNQENQWAENLNSPPFLHDIQIEIPKTNAALAANLSLSEARVQRIFLGDKSLVNFTMQLNHTGEAKTANVTLRVNGQVIFNRAVDLDKKPETIQVQAQWEADPKLWLRGEATVEGQPDALAADNRLFFSLAPLVEGKVAVLAQSPYLRLALSPDVMRGQWVARILEPTMLTSELATNDDADVLFIESNYLQSSEARKLLWRYLDNGRGVFLVVNRVTPTISGYLRELGFEPEATDVEAKPESGGIQFVVGNHPIFHPFISSDYGNLMQVKISKYVRLKAPNAMPLVLSEKGNVLFFQGTKTRGKLFVAAFGFDSDQTTWPVHPTFIPFLDLTLQNARADDPTPTSFEPGEVGVVQLPPDSKAREVSLRDGQRELTRASVMQGRAQVAMPVKPGLYTLSYDAGTNTEKVFSINPSPKESQLTYAKSVEALNAWQMSKVPEAAKVAGAVSQSRVTLAGIWRQQFWWWLVIAGLAALILETGLAEMRKERS